MPSPRNGNVVRLTKANKETLDDGYIRERPEQVSVSSAGATDGDPGVRRVSVRGETVQNDDTQKLQQEASVSGAGATAGIPKVTKVPEQPKEPLCCDDAQEQQEMKSSSSAGTTARGPGSHGSPLWPKVPSGKGDVQEQQEVASTSSTGATTGGPKVYTFSLRPRSTPDDDRNREQQGTGSVSSTGATVGDSQRMIRIPVYAKGTLVPGEGFTAKLYPKGTRPSSAAPEGSGHYADYIRNRKTNYMADVGAEPGSCLYDIRASRESSAREQKRKSEVEDNDGEQSEGSK